MEMEKPELCGEPCTELADFLHQVVAKDFSRPGSRVLSGFGM